MDILSINDISFLGHTNHLLEDRMSSEYIPHNYRVGNQVILENHRKYENRTDCWPQNGEQSWIPSISDVSTLFERQLQIASAEELLKHKT